jgi:hypothetical protein
MVRRFDVFEHAQPGRCQVLNVFMLRPFVLERPEEAFGHGVVVTLASVPSNTFRRAICTRSAVCCINDDRQAVELVQAGELTGIFCEGRRADCRTNRQSSVELLGGNFTLGVLRSHIASDT